ncbi:MULTISPECIES: DinB family protein [Paenibacillus]|uniref:DinB-like domain-containing protein n=1 Tax=Paenibacillus lactis TaxID=228574 RepID=A0ABS4FAN5_9BACL|nr:DinB family protein [Paenibacillus lactis]MBP1893302.1 hypothetical protein [Paenibacillus lactis]MCM3496380.1 DinB family protein [Paenibacillus lactis]HAG01438.1 hypothetical protein [Paenibacillus lactis]
MEALDRLKSLITEVTELVEAMTEEAFTRKPSIEKWSKQEILGHLCDSALNNHQRFVRFLLSDKPIHIQGYTQDDWVRLQGYQDQYQPGEVLTLWRELNRMIVRVMQQAGEADYRKKGILDDGTEVTLEWLFDDYIEHMIHHKKQLEA